MPIIDLPASSRRPASGDAAAASPVTKALEANRERISKLDQRSREIMEKQEHAIAQITDPQLKRAARFG